MTHIITLSSEEADRLNRDNVIKQPTGQPFRRGDQVVVCKMGGVFIREAWEARSACVCGDSACTDVGQLPTKRKIGSGARSASSSGSRPDRIRIGQPGGQAGGQAGGQIDPTTTIPWGWVIGLGLLVGLPSSCAVLGGIQQRETTRANQIVQQVQILDGSGHDATSAASINGKAATLRIGYSGARAGEDRIQISLAGPGSRGSCPAVTLQSSSGNTECAFVDLREASYTFRVTVNGEEVRTVPFRIYDPTRVADMISRVRIAPSVRGGFGSVEDTRTLVGAPTPIGIAIRYNRRMEGDTIETELYSNGQLVEKCAPTALTGLQSGETWCQFERVGAGRGEFRVRINGVDAGRYGFTVTEAETTLTEGAVPTESRDVCRRAGANERSGIYCRESSGRWVLQPETGSPERPSAPPRTVSGTARAVAVDRLIIDGQTVPLFGVRAAGGSGLASLQTLLRNGGTVRCSLREGGAYTCVTARGDDLAEVVILNGLGRSTDGRYAQAEQDARTMGNGIWQ